MKKPITLFILLFTLSLGQMWADEITVYTTGEIFIGTGDDAWDNDASTISVDLRYGNPECYDCDGFNGYYNAAMTKTAYTYNGYPIYSYTLDKAAAQFRFKHFKNSVWKENYTADWHSTTGQIYRGYWNDTHHWVTYGRDITIYAVPESMDGSKWTEGNTLKAVFKYGNQESEKTDKITWTKTDYTYEGNYIYKCTFLVPYNVIKKINFYYNDGEDKDLYEIAWNDATQYGTNDIDGKIFLGWDKNSSGTHTWVTYGRDITIYTVPETLFSDGEKYTTPFSTSTHTLKCNFKYGSSDGEWVSPMPEMTKTDWKYNSATLYKVRMLAKYNVVKQMAFQYFNGGSYINEYLYRNNNADFTDVTAADVDGKIYTGYAESAHHWESYATDITLDKQSGSGGTSSITATVGSAMPAITLPTRVGYVFGGYYSEADGGGTQYYNFDGSSVNNWVKDGPTTLYAKWTPKTTTVTLKANGGSADGAVVATYDAALPSFDAITRSQHVLTGYWTSATGGTKVINADGSFAANAGTWNRVDGETLDLYAQWWGLTTPTVTPTTTNWAGSNVDISLSATSTYLSEPVVVFYVNDGTTTYEVTGAPYGSDGSSLGSIGAAGSNYSTVHKATFTATTYGTYTVTAKLYAGKFIDNFEGSATGWSVLGGGAFERVSNVEREGNNGSNTVMQITRSTAESSTAWTTTAEGNGTKTDWNYTYGYIHMRYYAPQAETPKVEYWDNGETYRNTESSSVSAETWHKLAFAVSGGEVDLIHPFVTSADGNSIYIDDVVLSNEETMTANVTTTSASTTIYSLSSVTVDPTSSADYFDTPIDISLSATSTGLENSVVVFLVNDGTTTFEVVGTPGTPGGSPSYTTEHMATFTTSTPGDYTVTAKLYDAKLIDNFDGLSAYWKAMEDGTFDAATNPAQQAANGSSTVMQITRGGEEWKTVCTQQAADNDATTNWNLDYGYIYISMYSTSARATKMKYSDDYSSAAEVTSGDLSANTWARVKFTVGSGHQVDYILPFMPANGTMYIDDIILSNESSMTAKATSVGDATAFRVNDNKYYFTGNNKSSTAWNTAANWNRGAVPSSTSEVFILAPVVIATGTTVHVDKVNIVTGGSITPPNGSAMTASGRLTLAPNAGLNVTGKIKKIADGADLETRIATTPEDLILESSAAGNASLIFENDANQASVQMYSKAYIDGETWNWQFMGIPFTTTKANPTYYNSYLYKWASNISGWEEVANGAAMTPFTGYCITQDAATTYEMEGTLNPNNNVEINIPAAKEFVMANSWTGPIFVSGFTNTTLPLTDKTIYLYNTGYTPDPENPAEPGTEAGTYVAVPIHSAPYTGNDLIAPMQGFYVDNTSGLAATVTLKYDELVRPSIDRTIIAGPMHAPKRTQDEENRPTVLKLWANGAVYNDCAVVLEREDFSTGFDNGWDGKKLSFGEVGPSVYVINSLGTPEAVSAIPNLEGTVLGFRAGTNNTCTMTFEYDGDETFYINDLQAQQSALIDNESTYTFATDASDDEARFVISATPIAKTPTGVDTVTDSPSTLTRKILLNDHIYIIREGRMFSMDGRLVK